MAQDSLRFLGDENGSVDCTCDILDKPSSIFNYVQYMFDRTNRMFRYTGLPYTLPDYMLEYMLQIYGSVAVLEYNDNIYAFRCHFGGPQDPYYRPTQAVVANPALGITGTYAIANNLAPFDVTTWSEMPKCIRFLNDTQIQGLLPLFARYATQMTENDISIRCAQINLRQQTIIAADTGNDIESADIYIKNLEAGKLSNIAKRPFLDGVKVANASTGQNNTVMQLIELQQYLKASWYNEIGLNSNFNMKRQYVSSDEINSTADIMLPLIDNMFECRKQAVREINELFGTDITVEKDSAWEKKQIQSDMSIFPDNVQPNVEVPDESLVQEASEEIAQQDAEQASDDQSASEEQPQVIVEDSSVDETANESPVDHLTEEEKESPDEEEDKQDETE